MCKFAKTLKNIFFSGRRSVLKILSVFFFDLKKLPILSFSSPINGLRKEKDWICRRDLYKVVHCYVSKLCYSDMLIRFINFSYHYQFIIFLQTKFGKLKFKRALPSALRADHRIFRNAQLHYALSVGYKGLTMHLPFEVDRGWGGGGEGRKRLIIIFFSSGYRTFFLTYNGVTFFSSVIRHKRYFFQCTNFLQGISLEEVFSRNQSPGYLFLKSLIPRPLKRQMVGS